jgi:hypothetical protein
MQSYNRALLIESTGPVVSCWQAVVKIRLLGPTEYELANVPESQEIPKARLLIIVVVMNMLK